MDRKVENGNTSMNVSVVYDGYEEKISELVDKVEKKEGEIRDAWDKNRDLQLQVN